MRGRYRRRYDLVEKRAAYRKIESLRCYLIIDAEARAIEVDERVNAGWATRRLTEEALLLGNGELGTDEVFARTSFA